MWNLPKVQNSGCHRLRRFYVIDALTAVRRIPDICSLDDPVRTPGENWARCGCSMPCSGEVRGERRHRREGSDWKKPEMWCIRNLERGGGEEEEEEEEEVQ
ncbi:hypothetical protein PoB_005600100 [Plakobranchus ocellatus]|uniref:Uncharacterized protein n=1 Tax=Plakobranchus ocellatus TaxID=259542 RepID=A0AAV4C9V7_9GAST|nr:hypothetical protein PoB_005600100 [Plakobranchus ocellatus]